MALIGNCTHVVYEQNFDDMITQQVTYPDGTTGEIEVPSEIKTETVYDDIYLVVYFIQMDRAYLPNGDGTYRQARMVPYRYAGYSSREARDTDPENPLFQGGDMLTDYDYDGNVYAQCYEDLKNREGFKQLIEG